MKLTKRKGFNFFRSYYDVYNELETHKDKVAFIDALLDRQFLGVKPEGLKGMAKFAYISQTNSIDSQVKGYNDKMAKLGSPTIGDNTPLPVGVNKNNYTPTIQEKEKEKEKEEVKLQEKEQVIGDFKKSLHKYSNNYNGLDKAKTTYSNEMLKEFFEYWTESGEKDKKVRFEKEKSFGISLRLSRWNSNTKNNSTKKNTARGFNGNNIHTDVQL